MNFFIDVKFNEFYANNPITIIDVGAAGGIHKRWKKINKYLKAYCFEPDKRSYEKLSDDANIIYRNIGLNNKKSIVKLHLTKKPTCSSIYPPNEKLINNFPKSDRFCVIKKVDIKTDTLDNQLSLLDCNNVDFIKLDTQGSELNIIQGAKNILNSVFGLEIEVEFNPIYIDQPLFCHINSFLSNYGFQLFDLRLSRWSRKSYGRGQLIAADTIYFKSLNYLKNFSKDKILKSISICLLYGFFGYAISLSNTAYKNKILSKDENDLIISNIESGFYLSKFRYKITDVIWKLYYLINYTY